MQIGILGAGGNVAEAISGLLVDRGHQLSQFRFGSPVAIPGVPARPTRSANRIGASDIQSAPGLQRELASFRVRWIQCDEFKKMDAFIYCLPSYLAGHVGRLLGPGLVGRPLINVSDRFLGTYDLVANAERWHGACARPSFCVAFNGVPIMAQKGFLDAPLTVYFLKQRHSLAFYPSASRAAGVQLIGEVFGISPSELKCYDTMLHLAFENAHCIEHSVMDLENLTAARYAGHRMLYSTELYTERSIRRLNAVLAERDLVARAVVGSDFASLADYDAQVFGSGGAPSLALAGRADFRIEHESLRRAPAPEYWGAFGYEDTGWSMVTLESLARVFRIPTPALSRLIDDWCIYSGVDLRMHGRTCRSLGLEAPSPADGQRDYRSLGWLPGFESGRILGAHFEHGSGAPQIVPAAGA